MNKEKLEQNGCEKETLTIKECINRLETLFRSYSKDSEFNYQLSVSDSPFNQLKKLVSWQPIENYQVGKHDWVLVQFEEKDTKFRCIPKVAEFRNGKWHSEDDSIGEEKYLNEICKAIAFVDMQEQIIPIENENKDKQEKIIVPYIIDRKWFKHIHWRHPNYACINFEEFFILDDNDEIIASIKLFPNETKDGRFYWVDKERYATAKKYYKG